jgi:hypothetical protein
MNGSMKMTEEIFEAICQEIEETWEGLSIICPRHNISRRWFYVYRDAEEHRVHRYTRAREAQIDFLEDLLFKIAMDGKGDNEVLDRVNVGSNVVARARLQVDTIKFVLAKLRSHRWGDKIDVTSGNKPIQAIQVSIVRPDGD